MCSVMSVRWESKKRGKQNCKAGQKVPAKTYLKGVSVRSIGEIFECFALDSVTTYQITEAAKTFEAKFAAWRNLPLGEFRYLILDARYEKLRLDAKIISVAILSAIGVDKNGDRRVLGLTMAMSEAKNY